MNELVKLDMIEGLGEDVSGHIISPMVIEDNGAIVVSFVDVVVVHHDVFGLQCQKFIRFYLFSHFELFLPTDTHPLTHVLTFAMLLPHVSSPLSYCIFTIHTKSEPSRTPAKSIQTSIKDRSIYLQGSSPGTFSHPIPYRKALPSNSFFDHSSMNS